MIQQWNGQPISEPGIYLMTKDQYHKDPCAEPSLSRTCIETLINKSPYHAWAFHPRGLNLVAEKKETPAMLLGTIVDEMLLGGTQKICISPYDEYRTNEAKKWRDDTKAAGNIAVKPEIFEEATRIVTSFRNKMTKENYNLPSEFPTENFQHVFIWKENGVWNRAMLDAYNDIIWDLKTTGADAAPDAWSRNQLFGSSLELQAAYYDRAHFNVKGKYLPFLFAVIEQDAPYDCYPMAVDDNDLARAQDQITYAQNIWRGCLDKKIWPGYARGIIHAASAPYVQAAWESRKSLDKTLEMLRAA